MVIFECSPGPRGYLTPDARAWPFSLSPSNGAREALLLNLVSLILALQAARILALTRPTLRTFSQAGRQLSAAAAAKDRKFVRRAEPSRQREWACALCIPRELSHSSGLERGEVLRTR